MTAVFSRRSDSAERLASSLDTRAVSSLHEAADLADLILLTVPDDVIGQTAGELAGHLCVAKRLFIRLVRWMLIVLELLREWVHWLEAGIPRMHLRLWMCLKAL